MSQHSSPYLMNWKNDPIAEVSGLTCIFAHSHFSLQVTGEHWCGTLIDDNFAAYNMTAS